MPKILLVLALIGCLAAPASAEVFVGIKGGGSLEQLWEPPLDFSGFVLGLTGGMFCKVKMADFFALQPEVMWVTKGGKYNTNKSWDPASGQLEADTAFTTTHSLQYVEVPLLFKLIAPEYRESDPHLLVGPYYGYQLKRKSKRTSSTSTPIGVISPLDSVPQPVVGEENIHQYGLVLGGGIDFGLGTFDLRYTIGFTPVEKTGALKAHPLVLTAMFGFLF